ARGETLGLVGESGCGKSTTGRAILKLVPLTAGRIRFEGRDLAPLSGEALRQARRDFQMIFQDPYASLNPRMTVGEIVAEPLRTFGIARGKALQEEVKELLDVVGLSARILNRYPHEFSGGQRQRIGIARALALRPKLIVADEPISALDVSIQAQILNLLQRLQERFHLTYLFIAHDLAAVKQISDRIAVMYLGKIVEVAPYAAIYDDPLHPYTQALISAVPVPDPVVEATRKRIVLTGDVPSPIAPPSGCRFHTRCPVRIARCALETPRLAEYAPGHYAACHLLETPNA
ncbi:MAG: ATP-binding cassette domain-containing protein, partial [Deltaproteobacteria bacterium]